MIVGIDISNWQNAVDFNAVKASGREFVIIKATEGTSYVDPWWQRHVAGARAAGLVVFHYHFARPDLGNAASAEADFFANTINLPNGEGAMLDMESGSGSLSGWLMSCADRIQARTQAPLTIIYTGNWYIAGRLTDARLATYRLCDAVYNPGTQFPSPPPPWTTGPDFWQHTDKATVPGVTGACDEDYFAGTMDELRAMCKGGPAVAPPDTGADMTPDKEASVDEAYTWMVYADVLGRIADKDGYAWALGEARKSHSNLLWEVINGKEYMSNGGLLGIIAQQQAKIDALTARLSQDEQNTVHQAGAAASQAVIDDIQKLHDHLAAQK